MFLMLDLVCLFWFLFDHCVKQEAVSGQLGTKVLKAPQRKFIDWRFLETSLKVIHIIQADDLLH